MDGECYIIIYIKSIKHSTMQKTYVDVNDKNIYQWKRENYGNSRFVKTELKYFSSKPLILECEIVLDGNTEILYLKA